MLWNQDEYLSARKPNIIRLNVSSFSKIIDLSHSYSAETIYWPTEEKFKLEKESDGITENGYYYAANKFFSPEHGGTHIDAPIHFSKGSPTVDEIPMQKLVSNGVVIDVSKKCEDNPDYRIMINDFKDWENKIGIIPENSMVFLYTGFSKFWPDPIKYMGTDQRGKDAISQLHFPGLHHDAASWLIENRKISAVGLDTPSIDFGQSKKFETHRALCTSHVPAIENVANLDKLPPTGSIVIALPMKIKGGSGAPVRIIALIP